MESLWSGTPCIASAGIPSIACLGEQGIEALAANHSDLLAAAVERFLDADYAMAKTKEALAARLPTWHEFGQRAKEWLISLPSGPSIRPEMLSLLLDVPVPATLTWRSRLMSFVPSPVRPAIRSARMTAKKLLRM